MELTNTFQTPITQDKTYTAVYTNSFDGNNLTLADVAMISQWEDPTKWLHVGTEIPAQDHMGYDNPWIIVHYGDKTVYNEQSGAEEVQTGFFLQQKFHVPISTIWSTTTGAHVVTDIYGAPWVFLENMEGAEHMAVVVSNGVMLHEKMWIPIRNQIAHNTSDTFSYYNDSPTYVSRVAAHLSSSPATTQEYASSVCIALDTLTRFYYPTSTSSTTLGTSTSNTTSYAMQPRFCCFIKGKKKQEN